MSCLDLTLLGLVTVATDLDTAEAVRLALGCALHMAAGSSLLSIISQPAQDKLTQAAVAGSAHSAVNGGEHLVSLIPLLDCAKVHVDEVTGPTSEVVENVSSVDDGALSDLGLTLKPAEELGAAEDVKIDGDLVEQENGPGSHETHGKLNATTLTVRDGVHAPVGVDIEHSYELISTLGVSIATDGAEKLIDTNIVANNGVEDPLEAEISDTLETLLEGINSADGDGVAG
jgi:hypothetical protein